MPLPFADVAPFDPLDPRGASPLIWIAAGFLILALVLAILWMKRPRSKGPEDIEHYR